MGDCFEPGCFGEDGQDDGQNSAENSSRPFTDQPLGNTGVGVLAALFAGRSTKDISEILTARRRELRHEQVALEEERRQWRLEARKVQKVGAGVASDSLTNVRSALDAKTAALNRSIEEFRALEQL